MTDTELHRVTLAEHPELRAAVSAHCVAGWPEFLLHDPVCNDNWSGLFERFPEFQFALLAAGTEELIAAGNSIPLSFEGSLEELPDDGIQWALKRGFQDLAAGRPPTVLCALQIVIKDSWQGRGVSSLAVLAMQEVGLRHGLSTLIAPVRPNFKSRYPLLPMESYVRWARADGLPYDPWMRVHARLGARLIGVCPRALQISGTVSQWAEWTGLQFPESGPYIVPGALVPVEIDRGANSGSYIEPNVWMVHEAS